MSCLARASAPVANPELIRVQRKCACGAKSSSGGACQSCAERQSQQRLAVGASNDPLEHEADQAADQAMGARATPESAAPASISRFARAGSASAEIAPPSVERVLGGFGRPLSPALRSDMEHRFQHDFSRVRIHDGAEAARSAEDLKAQAYTAGHHIVFDAGGFEPATNSGRRLLAHELAHVVQQSQAPGPVRRAPKKGAPKAPAKPKIPKMCGRNSRKVKDNSITKVNLDLSSNKLTMEWKDPAHVPSLGTGSHAISPGTGKCCVDCDDVATSRTEGSLCTPKGTFTISHVGCVLSPRHTSAKNASFFQRAGVAIHSGNVGDPPRSHGCSRTSEEVSELVHDNVVPGTTTVEVTGTWASTKCYKREKDETPVNRATVCDGNKLKPEQKPEKKKPAAKAKAAALDLPEAEDLPLAVEEAAADGPGPGNSPVSQEGSPAEQMLEEGFEIAGADAEGEASGQPEAEQV